MAWHTIIACSTVTIDGRVPGEQTVLFDGAAPAAAAKAEADRHAAARPGHIVFVFRGKGTLGRLVYTTPTPGDRA